MEDVGLCGRGRAAREALKLKSKAAGEPPTTTQITQPASFDLHAHLNFTGSAGECLCRLVYND